MNKVSGIYGIENIKTEQVYIGKSIDIYSRWHTHKSGLRRNKHPNRHLQSSYNKYGCQYFEYIILERCSEKEIHMKEQRWIDSFPNLYNQDRMVLDHTGVNNPNFGNRYSKTVKWNIVNNNSRTKLKPKDVLEVKQMLLDGVTHQQIANCFNVCRATISRISSGASWTLVTGGPVIPVEYKDGCRTTSKHHRTNVGKAHHGKRHTEMAKQKMSFAHTGRRHTKYTKQMMSHHRAMNPSNAKLTDNDIHQIKQMILDGCLCTKIAKTFKIHKSTVYAIKNGKSWVHITGGPIMLGR